MRVELQAQNQYPSLNFDHVPKSTWISLVFRAQSHATAHMETSDLIRSGAELNSAPICAEEAV